MLLLPFITINVIFEFKSLLLPTSMLFIVILLFSPFIVTRFKFLLCVLSALKLIISTVLLLPFTISLVFSSVNCAPFIVTLSEDMIIVVLI